MKPWFAAVLSAVVVSAGMVAWVIFAPDMSDSPSGSGVSTLLPASGGPESVYLYFSDLESRYLSSEPMTLTDSGNAETNGLIILNALIAGPTAGDRMGTLPPGTKVRNFFVDTANRIAYVDFTSEIRDRHPGGSQDEIATVYSVVNSLALNLTEVDAVKILIDGSDAESLAGHMDLRFAFKPDMTLVR